MRLMSGAMPDATLFPIFDTTRHDMVWGGERARRGDERMRLDMEIEMQRREDVDLAFPDSDSVCNPPCVI